MKNVVRVKRAIALVGMSISALAVSSTPSHATGLIADGGFENQGAAAAGSTYCYFGTAAGPNAACSGGNWAGTLGSSATGGGGAGFQHEGNTSWPGVPTGDGSYYAFLQLGGTLSQTFTALTSGTYQFSWLDAGRHASNTYGGNAAYVVSLTDLATSLVTNIYAGATTSGQAWTGRNSNQINLAGGSSYTLTFAGQTSYFTSGDQTAFIDGVSSQTIDTLNNQSPVPEPSVWAMLLAGFALMGAALRHRPKARALA